ncbi:MAG TPA: gluconate 2-dehydrogenase subunit 3 family protein [Roseateles sp.]
MADLQRRIFLTVSGGAALVPALAQPPGPASGPATPEPYRFFNREEAAVMEAAVQRLIPPDELGPSAMEAGVVSFIDRQLAGAWGAGERLYRGGPWNTGLPTQGYQLPFTPAELFRTALRGLQADLQRRNQPAFAQMGGPAQDACLSALQKGGIDLDGVPSQVFFESLLAMTIEGYFGDPVYGGNRGLADDRFPWRPRRLFRLDRPPRRGLHRAAAQPRRSRRPRAPHAGQMKKPLAQSCRAERGHSRSVPRGDADARRIDRQAHRQSGPARERPSARPAKNQPEN